VWVLAIIVLFAWIFSLYYSGYVRTVRILQAPQKMEQARCVARDDDGFSLAIDVDDVCSWNDMSRFDIVNVDYGLDLICIMGAGYATPPQCWTNVGDKVRISDVVPGVSTGQFFKFIQVNTGGETGFDQIRLLDEQGVDTGMCLSSSQPVSNEVLTGVFGVQLSVTAKTCPADDERDSSMEWYVANAQWT
jgi:hypothetical protein